MERHPLPSLSNRLQNALNIEEYALVKANVPRPPGMPSCASEPGTALTRPRRLVTPYRDYLADSRCYAQPHPAPASPNADAVRSIIQTIPTVRTSFQARPKVHF